MVECFQSVVVLSVSTTLSFKMLQDNHFRSFGNLAIHSNIGNLVRWAESAAVCDADAAKNLNSKPDLRNPNQL